MEDRIQVYRMNGLFWSGPDRKKHEEHTSPLKKKQMAGGSDIMDVLTLLTAK